MTAIQSEISVEYTRLKKVHDAYFPRKQRNQK